MQIKTIRACTIFKHLRMTISTQLQKFSNKTCLHLDSKFWSNRKSQFESQLIV